MDIKTLEDVITYTGTLKDENDNPLVKSIGILAKEVLECRRVIAVQRFLIEHEEEVRVAKTKTKQLKKIKLNVKYKVGDRVCDAHKRTLVGTVTQVSDRAKKLKVRFDAGTEGWVPMSKMQHTQLVPEKNVA